MSTAELNQSAVWNTADNFLRSIVEPEDYGDYILPMTVLRPFGVNSRAHEG